MYKRQVLLFDLFDLTQFNDIQAHRVIDYVLARYGAYSSVTWCLHPPAPPASAATSASAPPEAHLMASTARPWMAMRGVMRMDDPYFVQASARRVLVDECTASGTTATY